MTFVFNNCRNRDHSRHGEGAFFELALGGRNGSIAGSLRAGDTCIVASYEGDSVVFRWFDLAHEKRMADETGELVRVLFGRRTKLIALSKATAVETEPFSHLFDRDGNFRIASVARVDWPVRNGMSPWVAPDWGRAPMRAF